MWLFLTLWCSSPKYWWLPAAAWKHQRCGEESCLLGLWSLRNPLASNNMAQEWVAHHLEQLGANPLRYKSWRADGNISLFHAQKYTPLALLFIFLHVFLFTVVLLFKEERSLNEKVTKIKAHLYFLCISIWNQREPQRWVHVKTFLAMLFLYPWVCHWQVEMSWQ